MNSVGRRESFSIQLLQLVDALLVILAFWFGAGLWNLGIADFVGSFASSMGWNVSIAQADFVSVINLLFLAAPFTPLALEMLGFYRSSGKQRNGKAFLKILQSQLLILSGIALFILALKFAPHRPTIALGLIFSLLFIWLREWCLSRHLNRTKRSDQNLTRLLLAGSAESCEAWWAEKSKTLDTSFKVVGQFDVINETVAELSDLLKQTSAERAVFLVRECPFDRVTSAMEECEIQGVEVWLSADFVRARIAQPSFDSLGDTPMLVLRSTPALSWSLLGKELMDRVGAGILLLIAAIPMIFVAIGIKLSDRGPVFFKQERAGKYGHPFSMWKFRTMIVDAEAKLAELKAAAGNQMDGPVFKLDHDPRIFRLGHFLRKYSIDELPQLFNVFMGEMSLVGPRPMAIYELPDIEKSEHRRKLSIKPGITCIWQVSGRNEITSFDDWVKLDLQYIDNWSLWLDIKILLKTLPAVLFAKGAK